MLQRLDTWLAAFWDRVRSRKKYYWIFAALTLVAAIAVDWTFEDEPDLLSARYWIARQLPHPGLRTPHPGYAKVLLIEDDEYYSPRLSHGRFPIRRDYLASLVRALDAADAKVIALDFNLALLGPKENGRLRRYGDIPEEYRDETIELMRAIADVARRRPIVLPKRVRFGIEYDYVVIPDIFGPFGICTKLNSNGMWSSPGTQDFPLTTAAQRNISCGYINLPYDMSTLPPRLLVGDAVYIDSFALAVARAINSDAVEHIAPGNYYGSYISQKTMNDYHMVFSAGSLLAKKPDILGRLQREPVIVGGGWHTDEERGPLVDTHYTPIGPTLGALIHANFTEALLDDRHYPYVSRTKLHGLDVLFAIFVIVIFAGLSNFLGKLSALVLLSAFLLAIQMMMLSLWGTFFDAFVPLLGVWMHSSLDRFLGLRRGEP